MQLPSDIYRSVVKMVISLCASFQLALVLLLAISPTVQANDPTKHVDLVCNAKANLALVRFSVSEDMRPAYPRLPESLDHGLSADSGSDRTDCTLANGMTIRVRGGVEQAFSNGFGGANPPAFFSMWINQHKVFSRQVWMPGFEESFNDPPIYDGVLIEEDRITICASAVGKAQHCTNKPFELAQTPIDQIEYGSTAQKLPVGHISIIAKGVANQRFCKSYLDLIDQKLDAVINGQNRSLSIDNASLATPVFGDQYQAYSGLVDLSPGTSQRLILWESFDHYFDGTVIVLAPTKMALQKISTAYPFDQIEVWPKLTTPPGVTLISGGQKQLYPDVSPRYVHLVPQRIDGALYVLAYPTNNENRPTAALVKPLALGGFVTLCAFNRIEPHY